MSAQPLDSSSFDSVERRLADNLLKVTAEVEKDTNELESYSGRQTHAGNSGHIDGVQQGISNSLRVLNALRRLSRSLSDR
jgi:hypothetical protein